VSSLLRQVRGLSHARLLAGGSIPNVGAQLKAVRAIEQQTCRLEHTNREWAALMVEHGRESREWAELLSERAATGDLSLRQRWDSQKEGINPSERAANLTSALQGAAHRLERLRARLKDVHPAERTRL